MTNPNYSQLYDSASYASRYEPEKGFFTRDDRIFHQPGFFYDSVARVSALELQPNGLLAQVELVSGESAQLAIHLVAEDSLRLKLWQGQPAFQETSPMIPALPSIPPAASLKEDEHQAGLSWGDYRLQLDKAPFHLRAWRGVELIFELEREEIAGKYITAPLGFRKRDEARWPYLSWRSQNEDRYFGFGEKFGKVEKSFTRTTIWTADTGGSNTNDLAYKGVPVLYSSAGWGLVLHSSYRSYWEVGSFSYTSGSFLSEEGQLDAFLLFGPSLKDLIRRYTDLSGRPAMPPDWALGIWMSRCAYQSRAQVDEVLTRLRAERIPCDVVHLDPSWMKTHWYPVLGVDACDFSWDEDLWPDPEGMFADFKARGFKVDLWINPYLPEGQPIYAEAAEKGYLARSTKGGWARQEFGEPVGVVDLTNPAAKAWWQEHLKKLLRMGAAAVKPDYGDRVAEDALFYNGKTGREMHNLFIHLYAEAAFEAVKEVHGWNIIWRRPGYIGTQRYPGTWAGDTQVTWQGMQGALRGGLSAGFSGEAFWSHDIGGFVGAQPSPELYIRWAQFGLLSPLARFHGNTPREPWHYGETALNVVRHYAELRYRLMPYLKAAAGETITSGVPILRHTHLEFPREPHAETLDDQYLLGPDLLIGPVLKTGATSRSLYFPEGLWRRLEDPSQTVHGPRFCEVSAPLEQIPVFVRQGAVIPHYLAAPQHLQGDPARELVLDVYAGDAQREVRFVEGQPVAIDYHAANGQAELSIQPVPLTFHIRLVGWNAVPHAVDAQGQALALQPGEGAWQADASAGVRIIFE